MRDKHTDRIEAYLARAWPDGRGLAEYVLTLWKEFRTYDVDNLDHFVNQLTNEFPEQFWQRLWEMQIGVHLNRIGHQTASPAHGPDFKFQVNGQTIWIEAISPAPRDIPPEWLEFPSASGTSYQTPNDEMLLRYTAAFTSKVAKFKGYAEKGITAPSDACVIAVSGRQLTNFWTDPYGGTRLPWSVEVAFPVGHLQCVFRPGREPEWERGERHEILNKNGKAIRLYSFMMPEFAGISALVTCGGSVDLDYRLPLYVAHNPVAASPLPLDILGNQVEEWTGTSSDDNDWDFVLTRVRAIPEPASN